VAQSSKLHQVTTVMYPCEILRALHRMANGRRARLPDFTRQKGSMSLRPKRFMIPLTQSIHYATLNPPIFLVRTKHYPKHTQNHIYISGRCQGLTITPFNGGHTLGGTIWKIRSPAVGTIVYAVNVNHMRERHLDGTVLISGAGGAVFEPLARPDLLITDADRANVIGSRRKDRDAALIGI
jgi:cleavage and polyadenylation specificity factor subunit 2